MPKMGSNAMQISDSIVKTRIKNVKMWITCEYLVDYEVQFVHNC